MHFIYFNFFALNIFSHSMGKFLFTVHWLLDEEVSWCVCMCVYPKCWIVSVSVSNGLSQKKKKTYQKHITVLFLSIPNRFEIILWGLTFWKYILSDLYFCRSVPIYHKMFWSKCVKLRFLGRKPEKSKQIYSLLMLSLKICIAAVLLKILFAL